MGSASIATSTSRGLRLVPADGVEDRLDVRARRVGVLAAKAVVGSRLEHEHRHRLSEQPVEPAQGPRRRLAAHSGVDDAIAETGRVDPLLDQRRVGLGGIEAEARREARPHEEDHGTLVDRGGREVARRRESHAADVGLRLGAAAARADQQRRQRRRQEPTRGLPI